MQWGTMGNCCIIFRALNLKKRMKLIVFGVTIVSMGDGALGAQPLTFGKERVTCWSLARDGNSYSYSTHRSLESVSPS